MKEITIELGSVGMFCPFQFGFAIYPNGRSENFLSVLTQPEPIFDPSDTQKVDPREFVQEFEGNVTMRYICDDSLDRQMIVFDSFLLEEDGCRFRVNCPEVRKFLVNHPGKTSPLNFQLSPIQEL